jgi:hypothetical protein
MQEVYLRVLELELNNKKLRKKLGVSRKHKDPNPLYATSHSDLS